MERNTMKYKVKQYLMFAGVSTVLFCAVVILPFIYGLYLTFTSWDGVSKEKPFVGLANYIATFQDAAYWQALGRTLIYSVIAVILVNVVAFFLAYMAALQHSVLVSYGLVAVNCGNVKCLALICQLCTGNAFDSLDS